MAGRNNSNNTLYLCEKPSQGRDIAAFLGAHQRQNGYLQGQGILVSWCIGHLLELAPPDAYNKRYKRWSLNDLPIIPQHWRLEPKKSTSKQLNVLQSLLKQSQTVVIATDADREGETIAREVLEHLHYSGAIQRLWLSALDKISIQRAFNTLKRNQDTLPLYRSGLARSRADWLIGMNLTRAFTLKANNKRVLSVGRVQTPTLALVIKRDREISQFKPISYYAVEAFFQARDGLLKTQWLFDPKGKKHCFDKATAQALIQRCEQQNGIVSKAQTQRKKQPPPLLYNLSALQQEASRRWAYGAQEVLNIAQALYETHKLTSYPRSDCEYLPLSQFNDVPPVLQAMCKTDPSLCTLIAQADQTRQSRVWNDKKITAHHAIIPTQATTAIQRLNDREKNIYDLIRRRYLAQFFADFEYDQSIIIINIALDQFKASGNITRVTGWKEIITDNPGNWNNERNSDQNKDQQLPAVTKGESLFCKQLELKEKQTKPPRHYTEGTLIRAMETIGSQVSDKVMKKILRETAGLGTQATRANIIQTLLQRKFICKDKKLIKATELGFSLIDTVPQSIKDPLLTAQWEQQLEDLANNKEDNIEGFLQQQINLLNSIISELKSGNKQITSSHNRQTTATAQYKPGSACPLCSKPLEIRQAVKGKRIGQDYIGCSGFPDCRFFSWDIDRSASTG